MINLSRWFHRAALNGAFALLLATCLVSVGRAQDQAPTDTDQNADSSQTDSSTPERPAPITQLEHPDVKPGSKEDVDAEELR